MVASIAVAVIILLFLIGIGVGVFLYKNRAVKKERRDHDARDGGDDVMSPAENTATQWAKTGFAEQGEVTGEEGDAAPENEATEDVDDEVDAEAV